MFRYSPNRAGLFSWNCFISVERKLHLLAWELERENVNVVQLDEWAKAELNLLEQKRISIQKEIGNVTRSVRVCEICQGECCRGDYSHFTPYDYLLRFSSENALSSYGHVLKPLKSSSFFFAFLRSEIKWLLGSQRTNQIKRIIGRQPRDRHNPSQTSKCSDLGQAGCILSAAVRPVRCMQWTCTRFRQTVDHDAFVKLGLLNMELWRVVERAVKIYKAAV